MPHASKDLLHLERKNLSSLESSLLVCRNHSVSNESSPNEKPITKPAPKSEVLGRVKDFLGIISEANIKLQLDAKDNSEKYNIEALDGSESEVIEMDLMLGIADLHTPEAVAAAESAIVGNQPVISLACSSDESESEEDEDNQSDILNADLIDRSQVNPKRSRFNHLSKNKEKSKSKKRPKIIDLS